MKTRGFEIVSKYQDDNLTLPTRQTKQAAGYDFYAREDFLLRSIWRYDFIRLFRLIKNEHPLTNKDFERAKKILKPYLVPTGIKAYMQPNEVLILANRSSSPLKHGLTLPNGIGVIASVRVFLCHFYWQTVTKAAWRNDKAVLAQPITSRY